MEKYKIELEETLGCLAIQRRLYELLIEYSTSDIKMPQDRKLLENNNINNIQYNIKIAKEYSEQLDLINKHLMNEFNSYD
tara:strand:+ start:850 stop:1089 length:240 start_codon:yes stop_codon:yes gene_type:complete